MKDTSIPETWASLAPADGSTENSDEARDPMDDANPAPHVAAAPADLETVSSEGRIVRVHGPLEIPAEVPLELFCLACACLVSVGGRMDRGWYSARKRGEREVELTVPHGDGDGRFLITLPESIAVNARGYEAEE